MKKILLTMFLLSFSSHALAKVEIWLCNSRYGIDVFKIDTNWPLNTAQRINSHWKKLWVAKKNSEVEDIIYDSSYKQIRVIYNPGKEKKEMIFDILEQDLIIKFHDKNKPNSKWSCELK
tara:strand:+ start:363 stop:719 length:357 start_codon:yes stop_codon:yes gene_type:complete